MRFWRLYRQEIISFFFCFVFFLIISFFSSYYVIQTYKKSFVENNAFIVNAIMENHPELEYEIMETFKNHDKDTRLDLLNQYGFGDETALSHIDFVKYLEHKTVSILFVSFIGCFLLFFFLVLFFYLRRQKRIERINDYLFRVLNNDYKLDLCDYKEDEISSLKADLAKVTNKLRKASETSIADKKNLERTLSDISHQLRTPLTSLYVINDALKSNFLKDVDRLSFLNQQKEQLERMEWLIVTLLKMSQIDSGTIVFQKEIVSLKKLIEEALKPSLIPFELKEIQYEVKVDSKLKCILDFHWTVEALVNLIKNAGEHTKSHGNVKILVQDNPMYVEIIIEDNGSGIKKEDINHIFERFYKGNTKSESIGIGLNLSKTIIEKQNGTIHVESEENVGTRFIIHFYKVTV